MFPALSLLTTLLLTISTAASPVEVPSSHVTLPLAKRIHTGGGAVSLVQNNRVRVAAHGAALQSREYNGSNIGSTNATRANPIASYIASVGIGSPPTTYDLVVSFGSANTWVGNKTPYKPTSSSKNTNQTIMLTYGSQGLVQGQQWLDTITLTPDLVVTQSISVGSTFVTGFSPDIDGMLGLSPPQLTTGTVINLPQEIIPTVADNLFNQAMIPVEVVSISLGPPSSDGSMDSEITFGGTDSTKYTGQITYAPVSTSVPASWFWSCNMSVTYGDMTIQSQTAGLLDIGQSLIQFAPDAYAAYKSATGAVEDDATNMLKLEASRYDNLENLNFNISSQMFTLIPNAQIWPRTLNSYIGGSNSAIYLVVTAFSNDFYKWGLDVYLGTAFLERFYTVLDSTRQRIGFATTSHTNAVIN